AAYAPHMRKDPLPGVPAKQVLIVFALGDETAPNPWTTAFIRAGDLADRTVLYRNDLAFAEDNQVPKNPHRFADQIESAVPLVQQIAFGVQEQIATFAPAEGLVSEKVGATRRRLNFTGRARPDGPLRCGGAWTMVKRSQIDAHGSPRARSLTRRA